jgi:hypothetical protein
METQIDGIASGKEIIYLLHKKYDFKINLYILQSIMELAKEEQLAKACVTFAKKSRQMHYYEGIVDPEGM